MTLDPSSRLPAVARTPREHERTRRGRASDPHADAAEHGTTETASYALGEISNVKAIKSLTFCGFQLLGVPVGEGRTRRGRLALFCRSGFLLFSRLPGVARRYCTARGGARSAPWSARRFSIDTHTHFPRMTTRHRHSFHTNRKLSNPLCLGSSPPQVQPVTLKLNLPAAPP